MSRFRGQADEKLISLRSSLAARAAAGDVTASNEWRNVTRELSTVSLLKLSTSLSATAAAAAAEAVQPSLPLPPLIRRKRASAKSIDEFVNSFTKPASAAATISSFALDIVAPPPPTSTVVVPTATTKTQPTIRTWENGPFAFEEEEEEEEQQIPKLPTQAVSSTVVPAQALIRVRPPPRPPLHTTTTESARPPLHTTTTESATIPPQIPTRRRPTTSIRMMMGSDDDDDDAVPLFGLQVPPLPPPPPVILPRPALKRPNLVPPTVTHHHRTVSFDDEDIFGPPPRNLKKYTGIPKSFTRVYSED